MLVLASSSPRRKELLTQAGFQFEVHPAHINEDRRPGEDPVIYVTRLAREKAQAVHVLRPGDLILGADTSVVCEGELLGKPIDAADAARMLRLLSGRTHQVITGVAVVSSVGVDSASDTTHVSMVELSEEEIAAYIATGDPMDKAGAYGIQGFPARWIPRISGCYFNVVGLPIALASTMIDGMQQRMATAAKLIAHN